jgi:uncharacterized membrane protein (UPF0127 family)
MKASRTIFWLVVIVVALGVLWYIARATVEQHVVPSFSEYMASTTQAHDASSTEQTSSVWMASSTIINMLLTSEEGTTTGPIVAPAAFKPATSTKSVIIAAPQKQTVTKAPASSSAFLVRSTLPDGYISAPKGIIRVLIAKTPSTRERGLSGYTSIAADQGMLFIFPRAEGVGFWMKDMEFPIDIVWMDKNKKITGVTKNLSPKSYPKTFLSPGDVQFVLELNAGSADTFGLTTGTRLSF